jgi:hypothetical protein
MPAVISLVSSVILPATSSAAAEELNAQAHALNDAVAALIELIGNRASSTPPSETTIARQPVADPQFFRQTDFAH